MEKEGEEEMMRIFIIGTTAVGKTKLSVEIAKHLGGEIVSCDSKQLYKYASIMTAKVTQEEAQGVPHYMVDCLDLYQNAYNRNKYFKEASKALQVIEKKKKVPIVVGGTNYYIQTLLYDLKVLNRKMSSDAQNSDSESNEQMGLAIDRKLTEKQEKQLEEMRGLPKEQKYQLLLKYDKPMALKTHCNDQKRITQFLQRIIITGEGVSNSYEKQTNSLRVKNSIVFWVRNSDKEELLGMVTKRIHKMLDRTGLSEIFAIFYYIEMHNRRVNKKIQIEKIEDYSGACSSIGVRQFKELYLEVVDQLEEMFKEHQQKLVNQSEMDYAFIHGLIGQRFQKLVYSNQTLERCREQLILDTKHYCKRQLTWIRNRMFVDVPESREHFFALELSQREDEEKAGVMERFERQIAKRAIQIIDAIKKDGLGSVKEKQEEFLGVGKQQSLEEWKKYNCQACGLELNGLYNWNCHLASKKHKKQAKYYEKKQEIERNIKEQRQLARQRRESKKQQKVQKQKQGGES